MSLSDVEGKRCARGETVGGGGVENDTSRAKADSSARFCTP